MTDPHFENHAQELADVYGVEDGALEAVYAKQTAKGTHTYCVCECGCGTSRGGGCCPVCIARAIEIKSGISIEDSPLLTEWLKPKENKNDHTL